MPRVVRFSAFLRRAFGHFAILLHLSVCGIILVAVVSDAGDHLAFPHYIDLLVGLGAGPNLQAELLRTMAGMWKDGV